MPVQVTFEQHDHVWFPLFEPAPRPASVTDFERRSIISGIGQSDVGRRLGPRPGSTSRSTPPLEAIADAGLTTADIDGIATYPGAGGGAGAGLRGPGLARGAGRAAARR